METKQRSNTGKIVHDLMPLMELPKSKRITFGKAFEVFMNLHAKPYLRSAHKYEQYYRLYLGPLAGQKLSSITRLQVRNLHVTLGEQASKTQANRALELVRTVFNKMIDWEVFDGQNPAQRFGKFQERPRERFLSPAEIQRFFEVVNALPSETARDAFLMALYTGARSANVRSMQWRDVDFTEKVWTIPGARTKNGDTQRVPLIPAAIEILQRRKAEQEAKKPQQTESSEEVLLTREQASEYLGLKSSTSIAYFTKLERVRVGNRVLYRKANLAAFLAARAAKIDTDFVFPSDGKQGGYIAEAGYFKKPYRSWARVKAVIPDLRIHDLRRSLGSWAAINGENLPVIGRMLGHRDLKSTMIYAKLNLDPVREAMEKATGAMFKAADISSNTGE